MSDNAIFGRHDGSEIATLGNNYTKACIHYTWHWFLTLFQYACTFINFLQIFFGELLLDGSQPVFLFFWLTLRVFSVWYIRLLFNIKTLNCLLLPGVIKIANLCGFSSKYCLIFFSKMLEFKSPLSFSIISFKDNAETGFPPWIQIWVSADTKLKPKLVETYSD